MSFKSENLPLARLASERNILNRGRSRILENLVFTKLSRIENHNLRMIQIRIRKKKNPTKTSSRNILARIEIYLNSRGSEFKFTFSRGAAGETETRTPQTHPAPNQPTIQVDRAVRKT
jgi:hypothetical protein